MPALNKHLQLSAFLIVLAMSFVIMYYAGYKEGQDSKSQEKNQKIFDVDFSNALDKLSSPSRPITIFYDESVDGGMVMMTSPCKEKFAFGYTNNPETNSMDPVFDDGNKILACPLDSADQLRIGDIIVYETQRGQTIAHRLIAMNPQENEYITQGDNLQATETITYDQIIYYVWGVIY